jgi:hypothetical protein
MAVVGDTIRFTVLDAYENDVTADATIYNALTMEVVGAEYVATEVGAFSFFASIGDETSNSVDVAVLSSILAAPADPDPSNLAFNHRNLFVFHQGCNEPYSPQVMNVFYELAKTEASKHYNEVAVHSYSSNDPAKSSAAQIVSNFYDISGYPTVNLNFYDGEPSGRSVQAFTNLLMDNVKEDGADAGVAMAVDATSSHVLCAAEIKANVAQEYKVTAWLLESNIYANQAGGTQDYHNIHNFALRNIAGDYSAADLSGESIGVLSNAETKTISYAIPVLSDSWNVANMGVLVIVSAKDENGRWEVANTAYCPVGETKAYEYVEKEVEMTDALKRWRGTYSAQTSQMININTDPLEITDQVTDFTFYVDAIQGTADQTVVYGLSSLGPDIPAYGYVTSQNGVDYLCIYAYEPFKDFGDGWYAVWLPFCDTANYGYTFVTGSFVGYALAMDASGNITYQAGGGRLSDDSEFSVVAMDVLACNPDGGNLGLLNYNDGSTFEDWKFGPMTNIEQITAIPSALSVNARNISVGEIIPASMVVAM